MDQILGQILRQAVWERLDLLDELATNADARSLASVARTELPRLTEGWRALLEAHEPDSKGNCPSCWSRWRPQKAPCSIWQAAHQHLVAGPSPDTRTPAKPASQRPATAAVHTGQPARTSHGTTGSYGQPAATPAPALAAPGVHSGQSGSSGHSGQLAPSGHTGRNALTSHGVPREPAVHTGQCTPFVPAAGGGHSAVNGYAAPNGHGATNGYANGRPSTNGYSATDGQASTGHAATNGHAYAVSTGRGRHSEPEGYGSYERQRTGQQPAYDSGQHSVPRHSYDSGTYARPARHGSNGAVRATLH